MDHVQPATLQEAQAYVGLAVTKIFDGLYYKGVCQGAWMDERGIVFYELHYPPGQHGDPNSDAEDVEFAELERILHRPAAAGSMQGGVGPSGRDAKRANFGSPNGSVDENEAPPEVEAAQARRRGKPPSGAGAAAAGPSSRKRRTETREEGEAEARDGMEVDGEEEERAAEPAARPGKKAGVGAGARPVPAPRPSTSGAAGSSQRQVQPPAAGSRSARSSQLPPASQPTQPSQPPLGSQAPGTSRRDGTFGASASTTMRTTGLAGHLEKIRLENFMCHEVFEMDFGPHVTLVSGNNGSGKSAVMQGLQACLGVKARGTGRATNLGQFIRTGCNEARIQVTVYNTGPDAFEFAKFGPRIIFDRRLVRGSTGHWKVCNDRGKTVTDVKPLEVLQHLNVNAGNALTIITQDMARLFLSGTDLDKQKKFHMFMEGTLLLQYQEELARSQQFVQRATENLQQHKAVLIERKKEVADLEARLEKLRGVDKLKALRNHLDFAILWNSVRRGREREAVLREKVEVLWPNKREQLEAAVATARADLERIEEEEKATVADMNAANAEADAATADLQRLQQAYKAQHQARRKVERQRVDAETQMQDLKKQLEEIEKVRNEDTTERTQECRQQLERLEAMIATKRQALQEADEALNESRQQIGGVTSELGVLRQRLNDSKHAVQQKQREVDTFRREISELRAAQHNRVLKFGGQGVVKLLQAIASRAREFDRPPIGPVGSFMGLTESKWATAIEAAIGTALDAFLCHTAKDCKLVRELAIKSGVNMKLFTVYQVRFDLPPHRVRRENRTTVMDVVKVTDVDKETLLTNWLVDNFGIERTVLTENSVQAREDLKDGRVGKSFDAAGTQFSKRGNSEVVTHFNKNIVRLGVEDAEQLRQLEEGLGRSQDALRVASEQAYSLEGEVVAVEARLRDLQRHQTELGKRKKGAENALLTQQLELQRQQQELSQQTAGEESNEAATQAQACQSEILNTQMELDNLEGKHQEAIRAEQEAKELYEKRKELSARRGEAAEAHAQAMERIGHAKGRAQAALQQPTQQLANLAAKVEVLKNELHQAVQQAIELRAQAEKECNEAVGAAAVEAVHSHMSGPVRKGLEQRRARGDPTVAAMTEEQYETTVREITDAQRMTSELMNAEHARVVASIRSAERDAGGNKEELEKSHDQATKKYLKMERAYSNVSQNVKALRKGLAQRQNTYTTQFDHIVKTANEKFHALLVRRHHQGRILVDKELEELVLEVIVKGNTGQSAPVRDLKQLSGGERSYTTVSFLLALGQFTESPFRCMDEFDVFMDAINRRVATETLLEFAFEHAEHQYIFLTPQDIQAVDDAKNVLEQKLQREQAHGGSFRLPATFLKTRLMPPARPARA